MAFDVENWMTGFEQATACPRSSGVRSAMPLFRVLTRLDATSCYSVKDLSVWCPKIDLGRMALAMTKKPHFSGWRAGFIICLLNSSCSFQNSHHLLISSRSCQRQRCLSKLICNVDICSRINERFECFQMPFTSIS